MDTKTIYLRGDEVNGRDDDNEYDPTYDEWLASLEDETADLEYISDEDWYAELYRSVSMDMGTWR